MRRLVWWVLSPGAYASATLAGRTRCRVLLGPFRGMRYPFSLIARAQLHGALQVGSYESELHETVEELIALEPDVVVNVGAAAGYYCVGLAVRLPRARMIAYESDAEKRAACRALAERNDIEARLDLRGTCTLGDLRALGSELSHKRITVIMDCEGLEADLVDPDAAGWLRSASLLVELHPSVDAAMRETLRARLAESHDVRVLESQEPWASRFPELWQMPGLRDVDRELLVHEHRHGPQGWLWARPRGV